MDTHTVIVGHGAQYGIIPGGVYYEKGQVDALLARIREAVEAEREAVFRHVVARGRDSGAAMQESLAAAAALDALLSGEGA